MSEEPLAVVIGGEPHNKDSTEFPCWICGEPVWLAPSSVVIVEEKDAEVSCLQCAVKHSGQETGKVPHSALLELLDMGVDPQRLGGLVEHIESMSIAEVAAILELATILDRDNEDEK